MGEILGLGMTHYPGMTTKGNLAARAKSFMKDPLLPDEFKDPATWPEPMRREWSNDEGWAASEEHRRLLTENFRWIRSELDAFNPDVVLIWGASGGLGSYATQMALNGGAIPVCMVSSPEKADIVRNAIALAQVIGVQTPRVAILAAVETVNSRMQATLDAAALCKMADRGQIAGGVLDGPLAFDNAVSAESARIKGINSDVAGRADVLVVPDLESGNMLAKQLEYLGGASSAGIVMGARVPVVLTSRSDTCESRIAACALAVLLAHRNRTSPP